MTTLLTSYWQATNNFLPSSLYMGRGSWAFFEFPSDLRPQKKMLEEQAQHEEHEHDDPTGVII